MSSTKRDIFQELCDGIADMKADREGKVTLRRLKMAGKEVAFEEAECWKVITFHEAK